MASPGKGGTAGGSKGGSRTSGGGSLEPQNAGNSRLFGLRAEVGNLSRYKNLDAQTQAGVIDSAITQLRGRSDRGALTAQAGKDISTLWRNTSKEAKDVLVRQGLGDLKASNAASKRIISDVAKRQKQLDRQAEKASRARRSKPATSSRSRASRDDDFSDFPF